MRHPETSGASASLLPLPDDHVPEGPFAFQLEICVIVRNL